MNMERSIVVGSYIESIDTSYFVHLFVPPLNRMFICVIYQSSLSMPPGNYGLFAIEIPTVMTK